MALSPGTRLGPYEISVSIGVGGMGEVYRAVDTNLKRAVAIKVLPDAFAFDNERLARFQREAEVLASLNHPNIAQVYGLEGVDGSKALVMELVEGPTLADRIAQGPIPLDDALPIARQVAEALEAAHEQGIIHRDLKSANVKVRSDGTVKVLDFGLAKITHGGAILASASDPQDNAYALTLSPTVTSPAVMTHAGVILGTAAYMAPEQAKGKAVDKRADIWAFGVVLYEMLAGRRPFQGNDVGDVLASVIKEEPKWDDVPKQVRRLLQRCLEKDPKKRLRDISGVDLLLERETESNPSASWLKPMTHWAIEAALLLGLALALWLLWPTKRPDRPLVRLDVDLGPNVNLGSSLRGADAIISPDGDRLVLVSQNRLLTRRLDQTNMIELSNAAFAPFFSPDGQWVGFFSGGLKKVSVSGGLVTPLAEGNGFGGSWGENGYIIASLDGRVLSRIPAAGGSAAPLTKLADDEIGHQWPQVLPGAKAVLFTARRAGASDIKVLSLEDGGTKLIQTGGMFGRYLPRGDGTGYLLSINQGALFAVPFDERRLEVRGTPASVVEGIGFNLVSGTAQFDASRTGTLVYRTSGAGGMVTLHWLDTSQKTEPLRAKPNQYLHPRLSPDGNRVALSIISSTGQDIWVYDWSRDAMLRLTFGGGAYQFPVWTPDGRFIVFTDGIPGSGMFWTRADGASRPQPLVQSKNGQFPWSFSPDGKHLAFAEFPRGLSGDIWTVPVESDSSGLKAGKPEVFLQTPANELYPAFSPDGRWIAYRSLESGSNEIYVRAFPDNGGKWLISTGGGVVPIWSPNGRELFYRSDDQRIMVVSYTQSKDAFLPDKPRPWSETQLSESSQRNLDISPDGKRFIAMMPLSTTEAQTNRNHVVFLQNFEDEVRRRLVGRN
jgi:serine/threonine protein kinase